MGRKLRPEPAEEPVRIKLSGDVADADGGNLRYSGDMADNGAETVKETRRGR